MRPATRSGAAALAAAMVVALAAMASAGPALAQTSPDNLSKAEVLFNDAWRLFDAGRVDQACEKFAESWRLDPAPGSLLSLAQCHERQGKLELAWQEYRSGLPLAERLGRQALAAKARRNLEALEKKLCLVTVAVPPAAIVDGLEIRVDGQPVPRGSWNAPVGMRPGPRTISARAPGHREWRTTLVAGAGGKLTAAVPPLAAQASTEAPLVSAAAAPVEKRDDEGTGRRRFGRRGWGYVLLGTAAAAVVVGAAYGGVAIVKNQDSKDHCVGRSCDAQGVKLNADAFTAANVANACIGIGLVAGAVSAYLLITARRASAAEAQRPRASRPGRFVRLTPAPLTGGGAVLLEGGW